MIDDEIEGGYEGSSVFEGTDEIGIPKSVEANFAQDDIDL